MLGYFAFSMASREGAVIVRVEPVDESFEGNLQFVDEVKGGNIPKEFIPAVQKRFKMARFS